MTRKILIVFFALLGTCLLGLGALAWRAAQSQPVPLQTVNVLSPTVVNFGNLNRGDERTFSFRVSNPNQNDVELSRLWTSCGCTIAETGPVRIPGNGVATVTGKLETSQPGDFSAEVLAAVRSGAERITVGRITFRVRSGWRSKVPIPQIVIPGTGEALPLGISLVADEDPVPVVRSIECSRNGITLKHELNGPVLVLQPTVDLDLIPFGTSPCEITVRSNSLNAPDFRLKASVHRENRRIVAEPAVAFSGIRSPGDKFDTAIALWIDGKRVPFTVSGVDAGPLRLAGQQPSPDEGLIVSLEIPNNTSESFTSGVLLKCSEGLVYISVVVALRRADR